MILAFILGAIAIILQTIMLGFLASIVVGMVILTIRLIKRFTR